MPLVAGASDHGYLRWLFTGPPATTAERALICQFSAHAEIALDRAALLTQVTNLQVAVEGNRQIGAAVGVLMVRHHLAYADALARIKNASQNHNRKLREVAAEVSLHRATAPRLTRQHPVCCGTAPTHVRWAAQNRTAHRPPGAAASGQATAVVAASSSPGGSASSGRSLCGATPGPGLLGCPAESAAQPRSADSPKQKTRPASTLLAIWGSELQPHRSPTATGPPHLSNDNRCYTTCSGPGQTGRRPVTTPAPCTSGCTSGCTL